MKKYILFLSVVAFSSLFYVSCNRDMTYVASYQTDDGNTSYLRIVHASPYFRANFGVADSFNVYVNGAKINSPFFTYNSVFPAGGSFGYFAIPAGLQQIKLSVNGTLVANTDSLPIATFTAIFQAGQYYSFFITDSVKAGKLLVQDVSIKPLDGTVNLRFVNTVTTDSATTSTGTTTYDIYSYARNAVIFSKIAPSMNATLFSSFYTNFGVPDTFYVTRTPASGTPLLANRVVLAKIAVTPVNQRTYTLYYKGDGTLTTGTKARGLVIYSH